MKKMLSFILAGALLATLAGTSEAAIGWAGQIWPRHDLTVSEGEDVAVYLQIWKDGVTSFAGQGAGISATLFYGPNAGPYTSVAMAYFGDVGNNDEYRGFIPAAALEGNSEIWFYCEAFDSTDATTYTGAQDQWSNNPPFRLNITPTLSQDVAVYFRLCLPPDEALAFSLAGEGVCVTGSVDELTNWGDGVALYQPCEVASPLFYEVGITFAAGGNPYFEYKYKRNGCVDWESVGNRSVTIDDSAPIYIIPWVDHWDNYVGEDCPLCGIGTEDSSWGAIKKIHQ